jgi:5-methylcytosine-specific restriction protein B
VNIDETTYMFSPKVLDRANTIEFRVSTGSLPTDLASLVRPDRCKPALDTELRSLLRVATDDSWQVVNAPPILDTFAAMTRDVHQGLSTHSLEFGHRTYYESIRLAAILHACGLTEADSILDVFLLQKVLPRLHGSRRKLEPVVRMLGAFAYEKCSLSDTKPFDVVPPQAGRAAALPLTYSKLTRMMKALRDNQFASFHD